MSTSYNQLKKTLDQTNTTVTLASIDGLSYTVDPLGLYRFEYMIPFSSIALTTGIALAISAPALPTFISYSVYIPFGADGTAGMWSGVGTSSGDKVISTGVPAINTVYLARIIGILKNGVTPGQLTVQFCSEVAASGVTVKTGAWGSVCGAG